SHPQAGWPHTRSADSITSSVYEIRRDRSAAPFASPSVPKRESSVTANTTHTSESFRTFLAAHLRITEQPVCKLIPAPHIRHALRAPHHNHLSAALNRRSILGAHC